MGSNGGISRRRLLRVAAMGIPVLALAACGGSAATTTTSATGSAAAATSAAATSAATSAAASATTAAASTAATTAATASATSSAAATSSESASASAAAAPAAAGGPATIVWMTRTDVHENKWEKDVAIPAFQKANPSIKINWINVAWADYFPKQMTMNAAGTPPDLWVPYGSTGSRGYEAVGMVRDLTSLIQADKFDMTGFPKPVLDFFTVDGHVVAMPYMTCGSFVFYNKDLFQKAGVAFPTTNWDDKSWTLDSLLTLATKLTKNYGQPDAVYGINGDMGQGMEAWSWDADPWAPDGYTTGYPSKVDFSIPGVVSGYNYFVDLIYKHKVAPSPSDLQAVSSAIDPFIGQKIAMSLTGGWGLWSYKDVSFKLGAAPFPWGKVNTDAVWPDAYLMAAKSKAPDQTWALLKYLAGPDGVQGYMEATGAPPANQQYLSKWYELYKVIPTEELKPVAEGSIKYGKIPPSHAFVDINQISTTITNSTSAMWQGKSPVATVLPQVQAAVTKVIAPNAGKKICAQGNSTNVCSA